MSMSSRISDTVRANCRTRCRADGRKLVPTAVGATVRVVRSTRRAPSAASSFFRRCVSAD